MTYLQHLIAKWFNIPINDSGPALVACNNDKLQLKLDYDIVKRMNITYANDIVDLNNIITDDDNIKAAQEQQIINLNTMLETVNAIKDKPTDEKIIWALENLVVDANNWREVNLVINDIFKVDITTFMVDMPEYRDFFSLEIYPSILENNGAYRFEDWDRMRGCNASDFRKILLMDPTDKLTYEADLNDCEDYIRTVKTNCQQIYGLTNVRTIYGVHNNSRHAFGAVYVGFKDMWIFEPQSDNMWRFNSVSVPIELIVPGWYDYR